MSRRVRWTNINITPPLGQVQTSTTYLSYLPREIIDMLWDYYLLPHPNVFVGGRWMLISTYHFYCSPNIARQPMNQLIQRSFDVPTKTLINEHVWLTMHRGGLVLEDIGGGGIARTGLSLELAEALVALDRLPRYLED